MQKLSSSYAFTQLSYVSPRLHFMRFFSILYFTIALAGCAIQSPSPQKLVVPATQAETSTAYVTSTQFGSIEVRTASVESDDADRWVLMVTTERRDGRSPDVTAAYALDALIPYIRMDSDGGRERGYIPMNRKTFEALSRTGMKIELLDGENRLHTANVPAVAFARAIMQ